MLKDKAIFNNPKYTKSVIEVDTEKQVRCPYCNRMICKGEVKTIQVKCPNCKEIFKLEQR